MGKQGERPVRPKCQCAERKEAMKRAAAALLRGDVEAASIEKEFVQRSLVEDAAAMKEYMQQAAAYYAPPTFIRRR